ncbi:MAG: dockerin type I domain-containing protein [Dehalococcoidia bacterium]
MKKSICTAIKLFSVLSIALVVIVVLFPATHACASGEANSGNLLLGDINGDGQVDILDFILLKLIIIGQESPNDLADIDGNGKINTLDIAALLDEVFGKSASPRGGGGGGGGGGGVPIVTNQVNFELSTYQSSYGPGTTGGTFTARVNIAQTSFLYNGSFTVDYDPLILQVNDVTNGDFSGNVIQMANGVDWNDAAGTLTIMPNLSSYVDGGGNGVSGSGYLCDIIFETRGVGTSPLTLGNGTLYKSQSGSISAISGTTWINSSAQISQLYNLNTSSSDHGAVTTPGEAGPYVYTAGQVINIVATPDACYHFVNWTGDIATITDANDPTTTITMNGDYSITANFAIDEFDLTTSSSDGGSVTTPGEGDPVGTYDCGDVVNLVATPDACYHFVNWTGTGVAASKVANPNADTTTLTMDGDYTVHANFAINTFIITVTQSANGTISPGTTTVNCGADQTFSIDPDSCYYVVTLTVDGAPVAPSESYTFTDVQANHTITAAFAIDTFDLSIDSSAGGSVTTPGEGDPVGTYDCGQVVNLVATPASSCYYFVEWTGDISTIANPNAASSTITMNGDYDITANFAIHTFDLSIDSSAGGSVTAPGEGAYNYDCGTNVPIVAEPDLCYIFDQWTGTGVSAGKVDDPFALSTTILIDGDYSVHANFVIGSTFNLTLIADPIGGGTPSFDGSNPFNCSDIVSIHANPDPCYDFANWTGSPYIGDPNSSDTTVQMYSEYTVTAHYTIKQFTLTYNAGAGGSITGTTPQTVDCGSDGSEVTATPNACYHFVDWSDGVLTASRTDTNVQADITVTANFAIDTFTLTYNAGAGGSITGTTPQTVNCGSDGSEVTATPDACYHFVDWSDGILTASRTDINVTENVAVTANFAVDDFDLTISSGAGGNVTTPEEGVSHYDCSTLQSIEATPDTCYIFSQWTGTAVDAGKVTDPGSASTTVNVDGNYSLQANFVIGYTFTLTLVADPLGGGNPSFEGDNPFNCSDIVSIHANTDPCYDFVNWTGSPYIGDPNSSDTTVQLYSEYTVTAHYSIKQYALTTNVLPAEAAVVGATVTGAGTYNCNDSAPIQAVPAGSYSFAYWTSDDPEINGSTDISESVLMDADKSVTANFAINPNTVYFESVGPQTIGVQFTVTINITSSIYLTYAYFDLGFNSTAMQLDGIIPVNWGNQFHQTSVSTDQQQPGVIRVIWDNSAWANNVNNGYGVNASGALCTAYFTPLAAGASPLNFVPGAGIPRLLKWEAWASSEILPSYWIDSSVTVE